MIHPRERVRWPSVVDIDPMIVLRSGRLSVASVHSRMVRLGCFIALVRSFFEEFLQRKARGKMKTEPNLLDEGNIIEPGPKQKGETARSVSYVSLWINSLLGVGLLVCHVLSSHVSICRIGCHTESLIKSHCYSFLLPIFLGSWSNI